MARLTSSLALIALIFVALLAIVQAAPAAPPSSKKPTPSAPAPTPKPTSKPKPTPKATPAFTVFAKSGLAGKSKVVSGLGCHDHNLSTVGSVQYKSGPTAQIKFYELKGCKGKVTHQMDTSTVKFMGGPYKSNSVNVFN
ncbi:hypothetical protein EDD11_009776 [Mortierella claussenii]|nr:hypothetical protein EDD11_009776 [Mortierella claussenii]